MLIEIRLTVQVKQNEVFWGDVHTVRRIHAYIQYILYMRTYVLTYNTPCTYSAYSTYVSIVHTVHGVNTLHIVQYGVV